MKIKVKIPHIQTYKNGSIFFNFNTSIDFDFDIIDLEKVCKKMKKCLKKELKRQLK